MRSSSLVFCVPTSRILIRLDHIRVFNSGFLTHLRLPLLSHISQAGFVPFPYWVDYTITIEEWHKREKPYLPRTKEAYLAKRTSHVKMRRDDVFLIPFSFCGRRAHVILLLSHNRYLHIYRARMCLFSSFITDVFFVKTIWETREVVLAYVSRFCKQMS